MKTQKEIEQLAESIYHYKFSPNPFVVQESIGYINGYNQCQENMADELIRFARMHVKAALEAVVANINPETGKYIISNKESILYSYNLDNIK